MTNVCVQLGTCKRKGVRAVLHHIVSGLIKRHTAEGGLYISALERELTTRAPPEFEQRGAGTNAMGRVQG